MHPNLVMLQVCLQRRRMCIEVLVILIDRGAGVALVCRLKDILRLERLRNGNDFELSFLV